VTEILEAKPIFYPSISTKNGKHTPNRAPPNLSQHGLVKWVEVRA